MSNEIQYLLYSMPDADGKVQVVIKDETLWCTQKAMAQLFGVGVPAISKHLKNIFAEGELNPDTTISKMETVVNRGIRGEVKELIDFYSLDAIIAVGYRVSSLKATRFRQWATKILKEYIKKGFTMDDERLKQGTAVMIQNRFHYAITGMTAAEIIYTRADHTKDHMGLTTWKHAPDGRVLKSDVSIAKNYLQPEQIKRLERAVTGFFDYIEDLIERENTFTMNQFSASVNKFLEFRNYHILPDKGKISAAEAKAKAEQEYDIFNKTQKIDSDFDKEIRKLKGE